MRLKTCAIVCQLLSSKGICKFRISGSMVANFANIFISPKDYDRVPVLFRKCLKMEI